MFAYLDREIIVASVFSILFSIFLLGLLRSISKNRTTWYLKILFLFAILLPFVQMYDSYTTASENIQSLKKGVTLKCTLKDNSYHVSTKDGWQVDKEYFVKESFMVRADRCERW